jgi:hypothetical protein
MVGCDTGSPELYESPVGYRIPTGGHPVMKMVSGDVSQVRQHRRQEDRMVIEYA